MKTRTRKWKQTNWGAGTFGIAAGTRGQGPVLRGDRQRHQRKIPHPAYFPQMRRDRNAPNGWALRRSDRAKAAGRSRASRRLDEILERRPSESRASEFRWPDAKF